MHGEVLKIERSDTATPGRHEAVYTVFVEVDSVAVSLEVLVGARWIGSDRVPYATFREPDALRIFARDHRPITDILSRVTAVHNDATLAPPTPTLARQ